MIKDRKYTKKLYIMITSQEGKFSNPSWIELHEKENEV